MKKVKRFDVLLLLLVSVLLVFYSCETGEVSNVDVVNQSIKAKYAANGPYGAVTTSVTNFSIYHPRNMKGDHPIITWGNGTGTPTMAYAPFLRHLATWGFVVIASNSVMTANGTQMIQGIDYLLEENKNSGSKFYGMLDTDKIGTTGHSQGGGGAINAATDPRVTCTAPISPAPGQIRKVTCPTFMVTGTMDALATIVRSMSWGPATAPTILGVLEGANHVTFSWNLGLDTRGYVTAWFMAYLQDDPLAEKAFVEGGELFTDDKWSIQTKNF